jgi:hypothetical protein
LEKSDFAVSILLFSTVLLSVLFSITVLVFGGMVFLEQLTANIAPRHKTRKFFMAVTGQNIVPFLYSDMIIIKLSQKG